MFYCTQSIVCATVDIQCLDYLGYITLALALIYEIGNQLLFSYKVDSGMYLRPGYCMNNRKLLKKALVINPLEKKKGNLTLFYVLTGICVINDTGCVTVQDMCSRFLLRLEFSIVHSIIELYYPQLVPPVQSVAQNTRAGKNYCSVSLFRRQKEISQTLRKLSTLLFLL